MVIVYMVEHILEYVCVWVWDHRAVRAHSHVWEQGVQCSGLTSAFHHPDINNTLALTHILSFSPSKMHDPSRLQPTCFLFVFLSQKPLRLHKHTHELYRPLWSITVRAMNRQRPSKPSQSKYSKAQSIFVVRIFLKNIPESKLESWFWTPPA